MAGEGLGHVPCFHEIFDAWSNSVRQYRERRDWLARAPYPLNAGSEPYSANRAARRLNLPAI